MIYSDQDYKKFAEKYEISLKPVDCPNCGEKVDLTRPFIMKKYAGLKAEVCKNCEHDSGIFRVVPTDEKTAAIWNSLNEE